MVDLAEQRGLGPQSVKAIAARQNIPEQYLEQLIGSLRKAKLVESVRGMNGGYELAGGPEEIRVSEVLEAIEGGVRVTECALSKDACARGENCAPRLLWERLNRAIENVLHETMLSELVQNNTIQEELL
jgi:Rrf2 family protein